MFLLLRVATAMARVFYLTTVCRTIGHDASWVYGTQLGRNRPVCRRCNFTIP